MALTVILATRIRRERCLRISDASIRPARWCNWRALFNGPTQRNVDQFIGFQHGDKPLPGAHSLNTSLLSRV